MAREPHSVQTLDLSLSDWIAGVPTLALNGATMPVATPPLNPLALNPLALNPLAAGTQPAGTQPTGAQPAGARKNIACLPPTAHPQRRRRHAPPVGGGRRHPRADLKVFALRARKPQGAHMPRTRSSPQGEARTRPGRGKSLQRANARLKRACPLPPHRPGGRAVPCGGDRRSPRQSGGATFGTLAFFFRRGPH
jgi:hypothetical protein